MNGPSNRLADGVPGTDIRRAVRISSDVTREAWLRRGRLLIAATAGYNAVEAGVALLAGIHAHSIALVGFGLDSVIEIAAAAVVLWRVRIERVGATGSEVSRGERRAHRLVGATFLLLAVYVLVNASRDLLSHSAADTSVVGMILAIVSLVVMPVIAAAKLRVANALGSGAMRAEARETLACSYLSFTLLAGLVLSAMAGWWWADPLAALAMVPWLVKEGREGFMQDDD